MTKNTSNGACLALGVETQALRSTGFHELLESIHGLDESKTAYDTITVDSPYTRCMFVAGLTYWAEKVNKGLLDYLEKISKGECVRVLNVDFSKYSSKDYWLRSRMKDDMTAYSDMPLSLVTGQSEYSSSLDLYNGYETIVCEMVVNFKKVESTFDQPQLYDPLMEQLKRQYADPLIDYEYAKMKERYIEPTLKDYLKMQVAACVEFLHSGMLSDALSICNEDIDKVDKEKILKMLDPRCKVPANLKELWAKFMKLMVYEEDVLLVPKRDKIRIQVLKHFDDLNEDQFRALFRLDDRLRLIHQDMIKLKPGLVKAINSTVNEQPDCNQPEPAEELFHFIHPEIEEEEAWRIHQAVKRLVLYQKVPEICAYLKKLAGEDKLLLPPNPSFVYDELVRLGMPKEEGYSEKYFAACYKK